MALRCFLTGGYLLCKYQRIHKSTIKWMSAALAATRNYPLLIAIIYFKRQGYARRLGRKIW